MKYDLIIIGAGPAGLSAAIYAGRYKLKTLVLDPMPGGIPNSVPEIQNWPGNTKIEGMTLGQNLVEHAKAYGVEIKQESANNITKLKSGFKINEYETKSVLLATGTKAREIGMKDENKFNARGVHYCTACDAPFYQDRIAAVIGGSNSAVSGALFLAQYASKVYIIYRKDKFFRAEPTLVEEMEKNPKIETVLNANITELIGDEKLTSVKLDTGNELKVDGLFIEIGRIPLTDLAKELKVKLEDDGKIKVDAGQRTNLKGFYAAGDITTASDGFDQLVTAAAEGTIAAKSIFEDSQKNK